MDRLSLLAEERKVLGKKVKNLRKIGKLPAHVFGKGLDSEAVTVDQKDFLKLFHLAGETGLINLKVGGEKISPVLVREVQYDPVKGQPIHIDFYQVNLKKKVKVPAPLILIGDTPESVHLGEAIVLQTLNEVMVEALPTDLVEAIEVDITALKNINDTIAVSKLNYDREKLTIHADPEAIVVKLAPAVSAEMEKLLEEEAAQQAIAAEETGAEVGEGAVAAQEAGEASEGGEEVKPEQVEEKAAEEKQEMAKK